MPPGRSRGFCIWAPESRMRTGAGEPWGANQVLRDMSCLVSVPSRLLLLRRSAAVSKTSRSSLRCPGGCGMAGVARNSHPLRLVLRTQPRSELYPARHTAIATIVVFGDSARSMSTLEEAVPDLLFQEVR